ncbi:hypothetical protein BGX26_008779, partial [Mortierella sp. AD094]
VVRVGELGSGATRANRSQVEEAFGGSESNVRGRKIDIFLKVSLPDEKPKELVAWEAKSSDVSKEARKIQLRKNIRINACFSNSFAPYLDQAFPRQLPIVLDIVGTRALPYVVRKTEPNIFVAGAVSKKLIKVPQNAEDLVDFMDSGCLSALLRIGTHNTNLAELVKKGAKQKYEEDLLQSLVDELEEEREHPIIFTPTKKRTLVNPFPRMIEDDLELDLQGDQEDG